MEAKKKKRKGNPYVPLRVDPELLAWIDEQVRKSMKHARGEPYDRSSFIRSCIRERREKYRRAKETQQRKAAGKSDEVPSSEILSVLS
jgi:Arc/MetJ-type ribon-helix-helix transcriptional regulator